MTPSDIQQEIDRAGRAGGGTITIPAGTYRLEDALHLWSGVHLVGSPGATLLKAPSSAGVIADYLGYGHREFRVTEPCGLEVGMGLVVTDDHAGGFYDTAATIIGRDGDTYFIDRSFHHDYLPSANARVFSLFPLISAAGITDASVRGLILDGNPAETRELNGCRGGAFFALQSERVTVTGCEVKQYHGDAVSFQQCTDIRIEDCHLHHNTGHGLHPGSGSVRYWLTSNRIESNGRDGIFYCLRTTHSLCADNTIRENGQWGISLGERDTDHVIERNTIEGNRSGAIVFREPVSRGADRVRIIDNEIGPNGSAELRIAAGLSDIEIARNRFRPGGTAAAVSIDSGCERILFRDNWLRERSYDQSELDGDRSAVYTDGAFEYNVGPEGAGTGAARHLGIELSPTIERAER